MKKGNRINALLMELMIVVLFFALASVTLVQVFANAKRLTDRSGRLDQLMCDAQDLAETIYAAGDRTEVLIQNGFTAQNDMYVKQEEGYTLQVVLGSEATEAGTMQTGSISAWEGESSLFSLDISRYQPKEAD